LYTISLPFNIEKLVYVFGTKFITILKKGVT
jgi:hypothetical protein